MNVDRYAARYFFCTPPKFLLQLLHPQTSGVSLLGCFKQLTFYTTQLIVSIFLMNIL